MATISTLTVSCTYKKGVVNNNIQQEQQPNNVLVDAPFSKESKKWYDENGGFSVSISEEQEAELPF